MFATSNSSNKLRAGKSPARKWLAGLLAAASACFVAAQTNQVPAGAAPADTSAVARANDACQEARKKFLANTNDAPAAWQFGRACFDLAELLKDPNRIGEVAREGSAACRQSIACDPKSAPAHYYLGMTLGQFADTKRNLAALKLVDDMEREFKTARDLDEHFDFAGPDRNLGLLYFQSPVILSVGSRTKARQHLRRAVELAPDYPENRLNLVEAYLKWGDTKIARQELAALEKTWPAARKKFADANWDTSWTDWESRRRGAKQKLQDGQ